MSNFISATLSESDQRRALELVNELKGILSFCLKLDKSQKKMMTKVDDARLPFVEKTIEYGRQQPKIVPPFTSLDEYSRDLALYKSLQNIDRELSSLSEMVKDTRTAAGTDVFQAALSIYKSTKGAVKMGIPGTQSMVDEMSKLFNNQGPGKKSPTENHI